MLASGFSGMKRYYERRAPEYDATTYELARQDPAAAGDLAELVRLLAELPPGRALDIGCGTGWLTRFLRGSIVGVDQSESMLRLARERLPDALLLLADVPPLPFPGGSFDRALASHVYSHIEGLGERGTFLAEALRVARELIVVEQAWQPSLPREGWEQRRLGDGSEHAVYKRYFAADDLAAELGGEVLLANESFVAVNVRRPPGWYPAAGDVNAQHEGWVRVSTASGLDATIES
jgi:SAM-dependent methyltransferase